MRRASAQIFSIGSHRKKHFSFGFRCGILSLVCRCFLKNSILYTEKLKIRIKYSFFHCRSPHGERGLKFLSHEYDFVLGAQESLPTRGAWIEMQSLAISMDAPTVSLPTRGAWIEIPDTKNRLGSQLSRSPHGERGLKYQGIGFRFFDTHCRSPHGERGLKSRSARSPGKVRPCRSPHGERGLKYLPAL